MIIFPVLSSFKSTTGLICGTSNGAGYAITAAVASDRRNYVIFCLSLSFSSILVVLVGNDFVLISS